MDGPRHFEYITEEIKKRGSIEIYSTKEDMNKLTYVGLYNQYMKECRQIMKDLRKLRNVYVLINIYFSLYFMLIKYVQIMIEPMDKSMFIRLVVEILLVIIHLATSFVMCIWKDELDFLPNVLITAPLLYIGSIYWVLLITNIVFCGVYRYKKGNLGMEPAYPLFYDLRIDRVRGKVYERKEKLEEDK